MPKFINLTHKKFGRLLVLSRSENHKTHTMWKCLCDCGKIFIATGKYLKNGDTSSCGCFKKEYLSARNKTFEFSNRQAEGEAGLSELLKSYKKHAQAQGREFSLTREEFKNLTSDNCYYCNCVPSKIKKIYSKSSTKEAHDWAAYVYNGIDRVDNNEGYIISNSVTCCRRCNYMKSNMALNVFIEHITKILSNLKGKHNG